MNVELLDYSRSELRASGKIVLVVSFLFLFFLKNNHFFWKKKQIKDHKPVRAMFRVGVRYVDEKKRRKVALSVRREMAEDNGVVGVDQEAIDAIVAKQVERVCICLHFHKISMLMLILNRRNVANQMQMVN